MSGHQALTAAYTKSLALLADDDDVGLYLDSVVNRTAVTRHYDSLRDLRNDAFLARIWLGIHFRTAMEDAKHIGKEAAEIGFDELDLDD